MLRFLLDVTESRKLTRELIHKFGCLDFLLASQGKDN